MKAQLVCIAALLVSTGAFAAEKVEKKVLTLPDQKAAVTDTAVDVAVEDEARKAADAYLKAITREGGAGALDSLLGGSTLRAKAFTLENFKVVGRVKHRHEVGELAEVFARLIRVRVNQSKRQ